MINNKGLKILEFKLTVDNVVESKEWVDLHIQFQMVGRVILSYTDGAYG